MGNIRLVLLYIFLIFLPSSLFGQDDNVITPMEKYLTENDIAKLEKARVLFGKSNKLKKQIAKEDKRIKKYFQKRKKKGERKSVKAKRMRTEQALTYIKAYRVVYDVYVAKINACKYEFSSDKEEIKSLLEETYNNFKSANKIVISYKGKKKRKLKRLEYDKLKSDFDKAKNLQVTGLENLIVAYDIYEEQGPKLKKLKDEKTAWSNAQRLNNLQAYRNYISNYPRGEYVSEAKAKIKKIETENEKNRKEREAAEAERKRLEILKNKITFQLQIVASKVPLNSKELKKYYKGTLTIKMRKEENWYKYAIGLFESYDKAKKFESKQRIRGSFVVAYKQGAKIDIKKAIEKLKKP